mgnify:CR=1 FL=1
MTMSFTSELDNGTRMNQVHHLLNAGKIHSYFGEQTGRDKKELRLNNLRAPTQYKTLILPTIAAY